MQSLINRLPANQRGPAWMLMSSVVFACMWGLIRWASHDVSPFVLVFYRNAFGLLALTPMLVRNPGLLATARLPVHLRRATSGVIATYGTFYAVSNAPLAQTLAINYSTPLFATVGAVLFLGEKLHARRIGAVLVGFAGVLIVLRPGSLPLTPGIAAAMIAAVSTAFSFVAIKQLVSTDDARSVTAWSFVLMLPVSIIVALFSWRWPQPQTWPLLAAIGLCAAVGQTTMSRAFQAADASAVMPYDFVRFGLVTLIGVTAFGERVDGYTLIGGALVICATIYLAYRETVAHRKLRPASAPVLE
jgi:drug/metabolite transporter (DMT)-like permease